MNYRFLNIVFNLLIISFSLASCKSGDHEFENTLNNYLEKVYNISLNDLEGKNCLFYNEYSCSSCFEINPQLATELKIDFLFVVGKKSSFNFTVNPLVKDYTIIIFDEQKEIFTYDLIIAKPLYFTYKNNQIKYIFLEDQVYEKGTLIL